MMKLSSTEQSRGGQTSTTTLMAAGLYLLGSGWGNLSKPVCLPVPLTQTTLGFAQGGLGLETRYAQTCWAVALAILGMFYRDE